MSRSPDAGGPRSAPAPPSALRAAATITGKDLRQRGRDRSAIVLGFVAPLAIAAVMSFAFRSAERFHVDLGIVDADHGVLADGFAAAFEEPGLREIISVRSLDAVATATSAVRGGDVDAAIVIPAGFSDAATTATPAPLEVLTSVDAELAGQVTRSIVESFVAQINANRLSVATAVAAGASPAELTELLAAVADLRLPVTMTQQPSGSRELKGVSYFGPAMGIFFVFFSISFTARSYFIEKRDGTLERMAAAVGPGAVLLGKAGAVLVYGLASLATMAVFTTTLFGADWGGPIPAAALCLAMVLAIVSITAVVMAVARTERQAEGIASIVTFGLALLGGNFVFVSATPPLLRRLALFTPNGWVLRGFVDLATGPHRLGTIAGPLAAVGAFTIVVGAMAALLSRRLA